MYRNEESEKTTDLNNRIEHNWGHFKTRFVHGQVVHERKNKRFIAYSVHIVCPVHRPRKNPWVKY